MNRKILKEILPESSDIARGRIIHALEKASLIASSCERQGFLYGKKDQRMIQRLSKLTKKEKIPLTLALQKMIKDQKKPRPKKIFSSSIKASKKPKKTLEGIFVQPTISAVMNALKPNDTAVVEKKTNSEKKYSVSMMKASIKQELQMEIDKKIKAAKREAEEKAEKETKKIREELRQQKQIQKEAMRKLEESKKNELARLALLEKFKKKFQQGRARTIWERIRNAWAAFLGEAVIRQLPEKVEPNTNSFTNDLSMPSKIPSKKREILDSLGINIEKAA